MRVKRKPPVSTLDEPKRRFDETFRAVALYEAKYFNKGAK